MKEEIITIGNVASKIKEKRNQLECYIELKNKSLLKVMPGAKELQAISVNGGTKREDKFLKYAMEVEEYDNYIDLLNDQLRALIKFEESELIRLKEYNEVEKLVITLKDKGMTWSEIEIMCDTKEIPCSIATAKRIWSREKKQRYSE